MSQHYTRDIVICMFCTKCKSYEANDQFIIFTFKCLFYCLLGCKLETLWETKFYYHLHFEELVYVWFLIRFLVISFSNNIFIHINLLKRYMVMQCWSSITARKIRSRLLQTDCVSIGLNVTPFQEFYDLKKIAFVTIRMFITIRLLVWFAI